MDDTTARRLVEAIEAYERANVEYDSIFHEVHERISADREAGKADIAVIVCWKRAAQGSWVSDLLARPEREVRQATRAAFAAADDGTALTRLAVLPGFARKEAISTALLCAFDPARWAVMDRNALNGLDLLNRGVTRSRGMTLAYFGRVRELSVCLADWRPGVNVRDVDKGLYVLGKSSTQEP
jgi:hypothetical protein